MQIPEERVQGELAFTYIRLPDRRYSFRSDLLAADQERIVLAHEAFPSKPLWIDGEEVMAAGYWAVWFLFQGRPYDVARFYRPGGEWTGYYVDILDPVRWHDADPYTLEPLVDLFLDLWITPEGNCQVLDEDEFEDAIRQGYLSPQREEQARSVLSDLLAATSKGDFPTRLVKDFRL